MDNFTIFGGPGRLHLCRTVHDGLKSSPTRRRLRTLGDPCHRRSPRTKHIGRQVRHFDQNLWQKHCENKVFDGNLANFSQNEDMHQALLHTSQRRLAEASPHDNLWVIGLRACDHHASSTDTWRGSNLLGQILEHVREALDRENMQQSPDPLPPDTARPVNHPGDTVFEVDPAT